MYIGVVCVWGGGVVCLFRFLFVGVGGWECVGLCMEGWGPGGVLSTKVYPGTCRRNGSQNQPPGIKMTPYSVQKLV